jgi:hypothetical protein
MGSVENHRRADLCQDWQRTHVRNERVVAKGHAAFGHKRIGIARTGNLSHDIGHVPWCEELAFFDIDDASGFCRRNQKIGLPAEKRRNLQHIDRLRDDRALTCLVHIREKGNAKPLAQIGEDRERLVETQPACARCTGAVGLVEGGFVDKAQSELAGDLLERGSHFESMLSAFQGAGAGDHGKRQGVAKLDLANGHDRIWFCAHCSLAGADPGCEGSASSYVTAENAVG